MKRLYFFVLKPDHFWSFRAFSKKQKLEENFYNTTSFTTSETELPRKWTSELPYELPNDLRLSKLIKQEKGKNAAI